MFRSSKRGEKSANTCMQHTRPSPTHMRFPWKCSRDDPPVSTNICPRYQCGGDRQAHMHPADRFTPVLSSGPSNCATTEQCSTCRMAVPVAACRSHLLYLLQCAATTGEQHRQVASGTECPLYAAGPPGLEGAVRGGTMPQPAACASAVPQPPQSHHALPNCCMLP